MAETKSLDLLSIEVPMRELAAQVEGSFHGTHRFLSHLVAVRREKLRERIATYKARGDHDVAETARLRGDPLAETIEELLQRGLH